MDKAKTLSDLLRLQETYLDFGAELITRNGAPALKLRTAASGWAYVMIGLGGYRIEILESSVYSANLETDESVGYSIQALHTHGVEQQRKARIPRPVYRLIDVLQSVAWAKEFDSYANGA